MTAYDDVFDISILDQIEDKPLQGDGDYHEYIVDVPVYAIAKVYLNSDSNPELADANDDQIKLMAYEKVVRSLKASDYRNLIDTDSVEIVSATPYQRMFTGTAWVPEESSKINLYRY